MINAEDEQVKKAVAEGVIHLTDPQAQAILDLRLHRLTGLEADKLREEVSALRDRLRSLEERLQKRKADGK